MRIRNIIICSMRLTSAPRWAFVPKIPVNLVHSKMITYTQMYCPKMLKDFAYLASIVSLCIKSKSIFQASNFIY